MPAPALFDVASSDDTLGGRFDLVDALRAGGGGGGKSLGWLWTPGEGVATGSGLPASVAGIDPDPGERPASEGLCSPLGDLAPPRFTDGVVDGDAPDTRDA